MVPAPTNSGKRGALRYRNSNNVDFLYQRTEKVKAAISVEHRPLTGLSSFKLKGLPASDSRICSRVGELKAGVREGDT
jgi:hypothetical protein